MNENNLFRNKIIKKYTQCFNSIFRFFFKYGNTLSLLRDDLLGAVGGFVANSSVGLSKALMNSHKKILKISFFLFFTI